MVITMAVLVAVVGVVLLLVPAPRAIPPPAVDPVDAARDAADRLGFAPAAVAAQDLGSGWQADYARVEEQAGLTQWRVGYFGPAGRRIDLEQAVDVSEEWLTRSDEPLGTEAGSGEDPVQVIAGLTGEVTMGGLGWVRVPRADGDAGFARRDGAVVTVLSSSDSGLGDLEVLASTLARQEHLG
jgi:hypothetical protein